MPQYIYPDDFNGTSWTIVDGSYYVSTNGSDVHGTGSPQSPFLTLDKAIDVAEDGEKIIVGPDEYVTYCPPDVTPSGSFSPCRVAATANVDIASGSLLTVDGVQIIQDDRVLLINQTDPKENGIYLAKVGSWLRTDDFNHQVAILGGKIIPVLEGEQNGKKTFQLVTTGDISIGSSDILFELLAVRSWGEITGDLSNQADLQIELDAKATVADLDAHTGDVSNPHGVTKSQVGLGNADDTSDVDKPVSSAQQSALDLKADITYVDNEISSLTASIDKATPKGLMDCSGNPDYPAGEVGDYYYVSVAGLIGGASGVSAQYGDKIQCVTDSASGDHATVGSGWYIFQGNLDKATSAEVIAGTDDDKYVTSAGVKSGFDSWVPGIDHNSLTNYNANEHIDWTNATQALSTSGSITSGNELNVVGGTNGAAIGLSDANNVTKVYLAAPNTWNIPANSYVYLPNSTGTLALTSDLEPNVQSISSSSNITPLTTNDLVDVTALTTDATIEAPIGDVLEGQMLLIRIKDDGTSRALTWDSVYRGIGEVLPTSTSSGMIMYFTCVFNGSDSRWDVISIREGINTIRAKLVGYWKLDERAEDSHGLNDGQIYGVTTGATSKLGIGSYSFDGVDDYVHIGDSDKFSFGDGINDQPFSISAWIFIDSLTTNFPIISKYEGVNAGEGEWTLIIDTAASLSFTCIDDMVANRQGIKSSGTIPTSTWTHVAVTYDGSGGASATTGMNLYIDGVLQSTTETSDGTYVAMHNSNVDVLIGAQLFNWTTPEYGHGKIDALSIWNRELSHSEILSLHNLGSGFQYMNYEDGSVGLFIGLTSYYSLNESAGDAIDIVGGNTGTVEGVTQGVEGKLSNSYEFDGVGNRVVTNWSGILGTAARSISLWFKTGSSSSQHMVGWGSDNGAETGKVFRVYISDGSVSLAVYGGYTKRGSGCDDNNWHHLVVTMEQGDNLNDILMYVDGAVVSEIEGANNPAIDTSNSIPVTFGENVQSTASNFFEGNLDEIGFWDRALSATEVSELYNSGSGLSQSSFGNAFLTDLVSHYALDEVAGSANAIDELGTNHGIINGAQITTGYANGAYQFDGVDDYIDLGTDINVNHTTPWTIRVWAYFDEIGSANHILLSKTTDSSDFRGFQVWVDTNGCINASFQEDDNPLLTLAARTDSARVVDVWYHLLITYDGSGVFSGFHIYVNGEDQLLIDESTGVISNFSNDAPLYLGARYWSGGSNFFSGRLDELAIWNRELGATEVSEDFVSGFEYFEDNEVSETIIQN